MFDGRLFTSNTRVIRRSRPVYRYHNLHFSKPTLRNRVLFSMATEKREYDQRWNNIWEADLNEGEVSDQMSEKQYLCLLPVGLHLDTANTSDHPQEPSSAEV